MTTKTKTYEPIPSGHYLVSMNRIEEKKTRKGGTMLSVSFKVEEGDHKNRLIFETFMIDGASEKALKVSKDRLSKYLKSIGIAGGLEGIGNDISKLDNFTGSPFIASVKVVPEQTYTRFDGTAGTSKAKNGIKSFTAR